MDTPFLDQIWKAAINFAWMFGGRSLALAGSLVYVRLTAEHLTPAEYATLAIALALANTLFVIFCSPLYTPITRLVSADQTERAGVIRLVGPYFSALTAVLMSMAGLASLATVILGGPGLGLSPATLLQVPLFVGLYSACCTINAVLAAQHARDLTASFQSLLAILRPLLILPLLSLGSLTPMTAFAAQVACFIPVLAAQIVMVLRRDPTNLDYKSCVTPAGATQFWSLARAYAPQVWIGAGMFFADKLAFALVLHLEQLAVYAFLQQLARAISSLFIEMGVMFLGPYVFAQSSRNRWTETLLPLGLVSTTVVLAVAAYGFGPQVMALAGSERYAATSPMLLGAIVLGTTMSFATNGLELKGMANNTLGPYLWGYGLQAALFIPGGMLAATTWGLPGVATALCAGALVRLMVVLWINNATGRQ